ncbi:MAG TPA: cupin domain-containing protein [Nitrospiria bacterium]|nr:cupin domain-containing protein [Nitrospiria bacterium]
MRPSYLLFSLSVIAVLLSSPVLAEESVIINKLLQGSDTIEGKAIAYPTGKAEMSALMVEVAPGAEIGLHMHPVPLVVYVMEGELDVEVSGGGKHKISAGKAFLEVVNTWHNGINRGKTPVKFLVVFAGEAGKSNLIRAEKK